MVRIARITIAGFRGARFPLTVDLADSHRSIAIFGENASGKSTITDALEWFLTDRVEHLWREDCKEASLRNVKIGASDDCDVTVEFSEKSLSATKKLTPGLRMESTNKSKEFQDYLDGARSERLILRNLYLTEFISKTKGKKRDEIAAIIGYDAILTFRNAIQSTLNALQRESGYATAKAIVEACQAKFLKLAGRVIASDAELFDQASELVRTYRLSTRVTDDASYGACIAELKGKVGQQERAEKKLRLDALKTACESLASAIRRAAASRTNFLPAYSSLVQNRAKIRELNLEDFLRKGKEILEVRVPDEGKCPFCGSPVDLEHIKAEVESRIRQLTANRQEYESARTVKQRHVSDLSEAARQCAELEKKWAGLDVQPAFTGAVKEFGSRASRLAQEITQRFDAYDEISIEKKWEESEGTCLEVLTAQAQQASLDAGTLQLTEEEKAIIDVITGLTELRNLFNEYRNNLRTKTAYERQIAALDTIFTRFVEVQNSALQQVLDLMSQDIGKFYRTLHPEENVDQVRLRIVGEEGVEFEYSFHGTRTYPPMKYLSESHLNSLGIGLFLASARLGSSPKFVDIVKRPPVPYAA